MPVADEIVWLLKADSTGVVTGSKQAGDALEDVGNRGKSSLKSLNELFGKRSALGQGLKLLSGGGSIIALRMLASEMEHVSSAAKDFAEAYARGDAAAKNGDGLIEAIPIIGNIKKSFDNVSDEYQAATDTGNYHSKKLIAQLSAELEVRQNIEKLNNNAFKLEQNAYKELLKMQREYNTSIMEEGLAKERSKAINKFQDEAQNLADQKNAALKASGADAATIATLKGPALDAAKKNAQDIEDIYSKMSKVLADKEAKDLMDATVKYLEDRHDKENAAADEIIKDRNEKEIKALESHRRDLNKQIKDAQKVEDYHAADTPTKLFKGGTVQLAPNIFNPLTEKLDILINEYKETNEKLSHLGVTVEDDDTVEVRI